MGKVLEPKFNLRKGQRVKSLIDVDVDPNKKYNIYPIERGDVGIVKKDYVDGVDVYFGQTRFTPTCFLTYDEIAIV